MPTTVFSCLCVFFNIIYFSFIYDLIKTERKSYYSIDPFFGASHNNRISLLYEMYTPSTHKPRSHKESDTLMNIINFAAKFDVSDDVIDF